MIRKRISAVLARVRGKIRPFTLSDIFFFICLLAAFVLASLFL
jgi:hypothetical protein